MLTFIKKRKKLTWVFVTLCVALLATPLIVYLIRPEIFSLVVSPENRRKLTVAFTRSTTTADKFKKSKLRKERSEFFQEIIAMYRDLRFSFNEPITTFNDKGEIIGFEDRRIPSVPIPESIKGIAGLDDTFSYIDRMRAADALGKQLTKPERTALLYFLHKLPKRDSLKAIDLNSVKNQVAMALMRQTPPVDEFPMHLVAMYYSTMDTTWRDYCVQFLGQTYDQLSSPKQRDLVRETLFAALAEKKTIAGSAIIALDGLSDHPGFLRSRIAGEAYKLAADPETADIVKIPALQIAAKYHHPKASALAKAVLKRALPGTRPPSVILRMSAIAALGASRDHRYAVLIKKFRNSPDVRLRTAAKAALNKL